MAVIRIEKTKDYTVMSNYHLKDMNLTLKAKGLMSYMLSLPEDWDYSIEGLVSVCKEGKEAIQSALKELEENNYLIRTLIHNEEGKFEYIYDLYENPCTEQPRTVSPRTENPVTVNNIEYINNKQNTNKQNTKINYKYIVDYLNEKADCSYRATTPKTQSLIRARVNDGFTEEDFKKVIDNKVAEWKGTEMEQYLRPETLFGTKFESYLNAKVVRVVKKKGIMERKYTQEELQSFYTNLDEIKF